MTGAAVGYFVSVASRRMDHHLDALDLRRRVAGVGEQRADAVEGVMVFLAGKEVDDDEAAAVAAPGDDLNGLLPGASAKYSS